MSGASPVIPAASPGSAGSGDAPAVEAALAACRRITRTRARNFYYGLRLAPEPRRSALYALYAWMRRADDLVDAAGPLTDPDARADAQRRLEAFRATTVDTLDGRPPDDDPVWVALADIGRRYRLPWAPFADMIDGQLADVDGRSCETAEDLLVYCRRVASSVGLLCIEVFGYTDEAARGLATDRGIAFQLTNVLRDFAEDHDAGRRYLPRAELETHGLTAEALRRWEDPARCRAFYDEQVARAEAYYERSEGLERLITPACVPTLWTMTAIYHRLLAKIGRDPARAASGRRVRLGAWHKGIIVLRARWAGASPR
ncbi:MAG: phytoene/squalene synthase family protein [Planctomycetota bacterium]|jgi:phytoene synthase